MLTKPVWTAKKCKIVLNSKIKVHMCIFLLLPRVYMYMYMYYTLLSLQDSVEGSSAPPAQMEHAQ